MSENYKQGKGGRRGGNYNNKKNPDLSQQYFLLITEQSGFLIGDIKTHLGESR